MYIDLLTTVKKISPKIQPSILNISRRSQFSSTYHFLQTDRHFATNNMQMNYVEGLIKL